MHTSQDQLISVILAVSRSWVKNSYTNAQLRAIAYTDKKRSASHLATAAKLYTCMSLIKHIFFQESHHIPTRFLQQSAIERYNKANRSSRLANAAKVTAVSHLFLLATVFEGHSSFRTSCHQPSAIVVNWRC